MGTGFLTIIPVGDIVDIDNGGKSELGKSLYTFPFVGLLIGVICVAAGFACQALLPAPIQIICVLIISAIITGGLHLDGLADTFDGICSWRSRDEKLKIMKDSRIGVMGALALILVLLTKSVSLSTLGEHWWIAVLLAPVWGRLAAFYCLHYFPRAENKGLASKIEKGSSSQFALATLFTITLTSAILWKSGIPFPHQIVLLLVLWIITHALATKISHSLGGLTGDACGAISELTEVAVLLALCSKPIFHNLGI